ncbi:hypothetical protein Tco_1149523 [Tanacetum coccineum]
MGMQIDSPMGMGTGMGMRLRNGDGDDLESYNEMELKSKLDVTKRGVVLGWVVMEPGGGLRWSGGYWAGDEACFVAVCAQCGGGRSRCGGGWVLPVLVEEVGVWSGYVARWCCLGEQCCLILE